jgi:hypothetical protein
MAGLESRSGPVDGRRLRDEAALPARELVTTFAWSAPVPAQRFSLSAIARP